MKKEESQTKSSSFFGPAIPRLDKVEASLPASVRSFLVTGPKITKRTFLMVLILIYKGSHGLIPLEQH
jgi:hypothetical protein